MTNQTPPPRWATWLLHRCCAPTRLEDIEGDLAEQFYVQRQRHGAPRAYLTYWIDVLRFAVAPHVRRSRRPAYDQARSPIMLKNYLKIAFRTLKRHTGYTFINVMGLAVGMACCLLILLYIQDELGYDRFHDNADRIVRVIREVQDNDGTWRGRAATPYLLQPLIREEFPQVEQAVRLAETSQVVRYDDQQFTEDDFFFADSTVFDVFSFDFIQGDPATALNQPFSVVITAPTAYKYFGEADPLGQTLTVDNARTFMVTGVIKEVPANAHFHFDFLAALSSTRSWYGQSMFTHWGSVWTYTYLLLAENTTPDDLAAQLDAFVKRHLPPDIPFPVRLQIQPLTDIHLHSHLNAEIEPTSDISYLYIFSLVAVFILLIACINFMNLATARAASRAREVGVRKMMGAYRGQLILQFLSESLLMSLGAMTLGLALAALALPLLNAVAGKTLSLSLFSNPL
ncbi:MAG TPA: ABC transporter permease, partial [Rhodothermales bacterium]|nr:ABC transporter permease [Rhodothermales bacterium]